MEKMRRFNLTAICFVLFFFCIIETGEAEDDADLSVIEIEKTVVTETTFDSTLFELPASVTILTKEDIEASSAKTVDQLLQNTVGVNVWKPQGVFGPASQVRLRGFSNSRATVFLLDGMPLNRIACGGVTHNEIPVDLIERVEIVRGINASMYGTNAMGGVVNIITKKMGKKGISASVHGSYGTYNTWTTSEVVGAQLHDKVNLQISHNHLSVTFLSEIIKPHFACNNHQDIPMNYKSCYTFFDPLYAYGRPSILSNHYLYKPTLIIT